MTEIPCPHCGQANETEREFCWACAKLLKPRPTPPRSTLAAAAPARIEVERPGWSRFRIGPFVITGHNGDVGEPLDMDPDVPVPTPAGFRFDGGGPQRRISWRWFTWSAFMGIYFAAMFGVPFAFMLYTYLRSPADKPWPNQAVAALLLLGLPPAAIAYTWLAYLVNRTTIRVDGARVTVRHGPLPCWGAQDVLRAEIARVYSERWVHSSSGASDGTAFEPRVTYRVLLNLKGGKTLKLATGLLAPEQAMFIEQQVRGV
jgi:hypothetical protein